MKIRAKLTLALFFMFLMVLLIGGVGTYYLHWLGRDAQAIITDNHRSLVYMRSMSDLLDGMQQILLTRKSSGDSLKALETLRAEFQQQLVAQQQNITEAGEQQSTRKLASDFAILQQRMTDYPAAGNPLDYFQSDIQPLIYSLETQLSQIYNMNEETILRKNSTASQTAEKVILYMAVFSLSGAVIGLIFIIGLPAYIARPIRAFNAGIREIAFGNYAYKLPVNSVDEFGELSIAFNKMSAKLKEYEQSKLSQLLYEKKRLDAVINQMSEAILGLDENKDIIFTNDCMLKLLGMHRSQVVGQYAPDIGTLNALMRNLLSELMTGFEEWEEKKFRPVNVVVGQKEKVYNKDIIDVVERPTGEERRILIGHVIILNDVTEFAEKDMAKTHFMATLSHELKTPVAAIEMSSNLLHNTKVGTLNAEQQQLMATIQDNNRRMKRTINEILDLTKIESGAIDILQAEENAYLLIEKALEGIRIFLRDKQLTLIEEVPEDLPAIYADAHKAVWILNNLLTNAIRFSPPRGSISLKAIIQEHSLYISVTDQGPGISREEQGQIFKKFARLNSEQPEGTGLGLAISKEFIEAMGGKIGVDSRKGQGATFWMSLPRFSHDMHRG